MAASSSSAPTIFSVYIALIYIHNVDAIHTHKHTHTYTHTHTHSSSSNSCFFFRRLGCTERCAPFGPEKCTLRSTLCCGSPARYSNMRIRQHTSAYVHQHTYISIRQHTYVSICTSAYVRQHMSAYALCDPQYVQHLLRQICSMRTHM